MDTNKVLTYKSEDTLSGNESFKANFVIPNTSPKSSFPQTTQTSPALQGYRNPYYHSHSTVWNPAMRHSMHIPEFPAFNAKLMRVRPPAISEIHHDIDLCTDQHTLTLISHIGVYSRRQLFHQ
jgi:hypothetical protein